MTARIDRRQFVRLTGAGVALALTAGCHAPADYDAATLADSDLVAALGADVVRSIGARYRAMTPTERDTPSLRAAILASRPFASRVLALRQPSMAELVRRDFEHGHTVVVQGWILSATEARQCALYSLRRA